MTRGPQIYFLRSTQTKNADTIKDTGNKYEQRSAIAKMPSWRNALTSKSSDWSTAGRAATRLADPTWLAHGGKVSIHKPVGQPVGQPVGTENTHMARANR